jgi:hypothetical protein
MAPIGQQERLGIGRGRKVEEDVMGMDIHGRKPTGPRGEYFYNPIAAWHALARYCNMAAPDICAPCRNWHSNDGDGLDVAAVVALAKTLETNIDAGRTAAYAALEISRHKPIPGVIFVGEPRDPYDFVENVAAFVAFLRESGGFSIR